MNPNYSKYSYKELLSAYKTIDKEKYPENYNRLKKEIENRQNASDFGWKEIYYEKLLRRKPAIEILDLTAKSENRNLAKVGLLLLALFTWYILSEWIIEYGLAAIEVLNEDLNPTFSDIFVLSSLPLIIVGVLGIVNRNFKRRWIKTRGKLVHMEVDEIKSRWGGVSWRVIFYFLYIVSNKKFLIEFMKNRLDFDSAIEYAKENENVLERIVFYNPKNPSKSTFNLNYSKKYNWVLVCGSILLITGFLSHYV